MFKKIPIFSDTKYEIFSFNSLIKSNLNNKGDLGI